MICNDYWRFLTILWGCYVICFVVIEGRPFEGRRDQNMETGERKGNVK